MTLTSGHHRPRDLQVQVRPMTSWCTRFDSHRDLRSRWESNLTAATSLSPRCRYQASGWGSPTSAANARATSWTLARMYVVVDAFAPLSV